MHGLSLESDQMALVQLCGSYVLACRKRRKQLLADIATAVKNREMPLPQYTLIHHEARLSEVDTDLLYGWARVERRRMKAMLPIVPTTTHQLEGSR
jgi:hypothetical protein